LWAKSCGADWFVDDSGVYIKKFIFACLIVVEMMIQWKNKRMRRLKKAPKDEAAI
jgi:hypothetical protein